MFQSSQEIDNSGRFVAFAHGSKIEHDFSKDSPMKIRPIKRSLNQN